MNICPKCGLPFSEVFKIEQQVECDYCGWSGISTETLIRDAEFENDELARLRKLFIFLAQEISPQIMQKLIKEKFFKRDLEEVPLMIPVLASTSRAMFTALITSLCEQRARGEIDAPSKAVH